MLIVFAIVDRHGAVLDYGTDLAALQATVEGRAWRNVDDLPEGSHPRLLSDRTADGRAVSPMRIYPLAVPWADVRAQMDDQRYNEVDSPEEWWHFSNLLDNSSAGGRLNRAATALIPPDVLRRMREFVDRLGTTDDDPSK